MSTQNFGLIKAIFVQSTPPVNTNVLWRDTTVNRTKEYDPSVPGWVALNANAGNVNWGNIGGILSNQTDLNTQLTNLQTSINTNLTSIGTINTNITSIQGNITTIQGQITTLQSQVHTQGTDQGLDTGGANAVTASEIRAFIDSKAQNSGLASLDSSGKIPLAQIPDSIRTSLQFQGMWNASSNTPTLASGVGTQGHFYIVSTPGGTDLDGETDWDTGDWAIFDGTTWSKVDNSERVTQVNGQTGIVTLTTSNISEGTNLYYTEARVNANTNVAANTSARHNRNEDQFTLPAISTETQLRAIVTPSLALGSHISYRGSVSGELFVYVLETGTDTDNSPSVIRPDDYAATTNERVWKRALVGAVAGGLQSADNALTVSGTEVQFGGSLIQNTSVSGATLYSLNFSSLTGFIAQAVNETPGIQLISPVGSYIASGTNFILQDNRATPSGIAYPVDYSGNQTDRNLVDRGTVRGYLNGFLSGTLSAPTEVNVGANAFTFTSTGQSLGFSPTALTVGNIANARIQADQSLDIVSNAGGSLILTSDNLFGVTSQGAQSYATAADILADTGTISIQTGNSSGTNTNSGNITLTTGTATGTRGSVTIQGLTYPSSDGTNGQVLTTNGSGVLSFSTISAGITNSATEDEIPRADASGNLIASGLSVNVGAAQLNLRSIDRELRIQAGNNTASALRNILIATVSNQGFAGSGNLTLNTGSAVGAGSQSGNVLISTGTATSGATQGTITIQNLVWPNADGTNGQSLVTDGSGNLSFATISGSGDTRTDRATVTPSTTLDLSTAITQAWTLTSAITVTTISNLVNNQETLIDKRGNFPLTINTTNFPNARITGFPQSNDQDILIRVVDATNNIFRVAYLDSDLFLGTFTTLANLQTAFPTAPIPGAYAHVDAGSGTNLIVYAYDTDEGWVQVGSTGGITNGAANNEIPKSDGTNLISSGLVSAATGNLNLGSSTDAGAIRTLSADGSATTVSLALNAKGGSSLIRFSYQGVNTRHDLTASQLLLGTFGSGNFNIHSSTVPIILGASPNVVAANTQPVTISTTESSGLNNNSGSVTIATGNSTNAGGGNSGNISIATGTATTTRGTVSIQGLVWPQADGTNGQVLTTDGSGNLSFTTVAGGGTPRDAGNGLTLNGNALDLGDASMAANVAFTPDSSLTRNMIFGSSSNLLLQHQINARQFTVSSNGPTAGQTRALVIGGSGVNIGIANSASDLSIDLGHTNGMVLVDNILNRGLIGGADFSSNIQNLDYTQKVYVDTRITGNSTSSILQTPTITQNGFSVTWDNANSQFTLSNVSGGAGITNGAANNEIPLSDGTNLVGSGVDIITSGATKVIRTLSDSMIFRAGDATAATARSINIQTQSTLNSNDSGDVSITTGNTTGASNSSGDINISPGLGSSSANSGDLNITLAPKPSGSFGHLKILNLPDQSQISGIPQDIIYDQGGFLRVTGSEITPAARITTLTSSTNATSMNFASDSGFKEFSLSLGEDTTISFSNATNRSSYKIFLTITGASRIITLPTGSLMPRSTSTLQDINWNGANRQLTLPVGKFELAADYDGTNDFWKITDLYQP